MTNDQPLIIVCSPVSRFADDVAAACARCACHLVHRPHIPAGRVLCLACARIELAGTEVHARITPETLAELRLYYAGTRGVQ